MGKCKKRTLNKPILEGSLSRKDAIDLIIHKIQSDILDKETKDVLTLFGITPEELTEAGATYEEVLVLKRHM